MFGRSKRRGTPARVRHGSFNVSRGANRSTIIAIGASSGVVAHRIIVGANRTTRRTDFCSFLQDVGREMLRAADRAGLPRNAQLYLMDNASIHKDSLQSVSNRLHVAYQPPYMPNVNPTELVNSQLKQQLKSRSIDEQMTTLNDKHAR